MANLIPAALRRWGQGDPLATEEEGFICCLYGCSFKKVGISSSKNMKDPPLQ